MLKNETPSPLTIKDIWHYCESNYQLFMRLLPEEMDWQINHYHIGGPVSMDIQLIEQTRYTSTIAMTSTIQQDKTMIKMDKWPIRLYHDAKVAEVLASLEGRQLDVKFSYPNKKMHHMDEKVRLNEHLKDWLQACLRAFPKGLPMNNRMMTDEL